MGGVVESLPFFHKNVGHLIFLLFARKHKQSKSSPLGERLSSRPVNFAQSTGLGPNPHVLGQKNSQAKKPT